MLWTISGFISNSSDYPPIRVISTGAKRSGEICFSTSAPKLPTESCQAHSKHQKSCNQLNPHYLSHKKSFQKAPIYFPPLAILNPYTRNSAGRWSGARSDHHIPCIFNILSPRTDVFSIFWLVQSHNWHKTHHLHPIPTGECLVLQTERPSPKRGPFHKSFELTPVP